MTSTWRLLQGHVIDQLRTLEPESVHMVVTSPPYLGLRSYGTPPQILGGIQDCAHDWAETERPQTGNSTQGSHNPKLPQIIGMGKDIIGKLCTKCDAWLGSLGQEENPERFVNNLVLVFREVRRCLRKDGVLFINIGDTMWGANWRGSEKIGSKQSTNHGASGAQQDLHLLRSTYSKHNVLKPSELTGVPARLALALQADGWYLKADIIWQQISPMPESLTGWRWEQCKIKIKSGGGKQRGDPSITGITGTEYFQTLAKWAKCPGCDKCQDNNGWVLRKGAWRPTSAHEYIFMFTKSSQYYGDREALATSLARSSIERYKYSFGQNTKYDKTDKHINRIEGDRQGLAGANIRDVWAFGSDNLSEKHYAVFPLALASHCLMATTSEKGCCPECRTPWSRMINHVPSTMSVRIRDVATGREAKAGSLNPIKATEKEIEEYTGYEDVGYTETVGWRPSCKCGKNLEPVPCTVLDPFVGSGTTIIAAIKNGRNAIGIELNKEYCEITRGRIRKTCSLLAIEQK